MIFQFHTAIGILIIALAASYFVGCKALCGDQCSEKCKKLGKVIGIIGLIISALALVCTLTMGVMQACGKGCYWGKKTCPYHERHSKELNETEPSSAPAEMHDHDHE